MKLPRPARPFKHCSRSSRRKEAHFISDFGFRISDFLCLVLFASAIPVLHAAELAPPAVSWLAAQTNIQTWSADFTQTRRLKSLTQPLTATGHVWFAAPSRFRWELGRPAQTIAVRASSELLIFYPRLKRVERFPLSAQINGPWRDALSLLETGFPRSEADLQDRYEILSQGVTNGVGALVLQPKSPGARRMIPRIEIDFDVKDFSLRGTELQFADGSTLRNDFERIELNPKLDEQLFQPPIPPDYKIVEPAKRP
jgi:outer membrane lipoprotein carrier protein